MKRTLSILALAVTMAAAANTIAAPAAVLHQVFVDSSVNTFDGGLHFVRPIALELDVTNQIWMLALDTSALPARAWYRLDNTIQAFDKACTLVTPPSWISIIPYPDATSLHFCHQAGTAIYGDQVSCSLHSGTYRPLGDGARPNSEGGGVRNGAAFLTADYRLFILVQKTATEGGNNPCNAYPNGPGAVGAWIFMEVAR